MSGLELGVATLEVELEVALALAGGALSYAEQSARPVLLSAAVQADALVLGSLQRPSSLRERSPARFDTRLMQRRTTGTEAQLSGAALYHALALPGLRSLYPDASARTLLNRNLRAIIRGYAAAGVPLRYFGTEVLALLGHPVALVGYDQLASGAVLIEVLIGLEQPCVVRSALKREAPASLWSLVPSRPAALDLMARAVAGVVERLDARAVDVSGELVPAHASASDDWVEAATAQVSIPLGVVEACLVGGARLAGDLLVSRAALSAVESAADAVTSAGQPLTEAVLKSLEGVPLDGARAPDVLAALRAAAALALGR